MTRNSGLYGLIACGGKSSRMGEDKSMLSYYEKPQCYLLYDMLITFCEKVFISCNSIQADQFENRYPILPDLSEYEDCGPAASLLTAFQHYPGKDFILIGCDYPFFNYKDMENFIHSFQRKDIAAAFYNSAAGLYEPLLAYYSQRSARILSRMHSNKFYSLQHFLRENHAAKFHPSNLLSIQSIDSKEDFIRAKVSIQKGGDPL